jgi:hypothetical protein
MRWAFVISVCVGVFALFGTATAQDFSSAELFGGVSYTSINTSGDTSLLASRQNAAGWESSGSVNAWRRVWAEVSLSAYYKSVEGSPLRDYFAVAGPRFNYRRFFVHALFGEDRLLVDAFGQSENGLTGEVGGGLEHPLGQSLAIRASADDLYTRHNVFGGSRSAQNNVRVSVGVVYRFRLRSASPSAKAKTSSGAKK